jgi:cbb3-type cytochrome oxidase subunit 1
MGIAMGASQNFTLRPVHAHVNLLGWTTMALAGLIYSVFPTAGESMLARVHFWLMNLALPVMMTALGLVLFGRMEVVPVLVLGEITAALGVAAFAANLFINLKNS